MMDTVETRRIADDGSTAGYRAHATFGYVTEFRRQLTRSRTQWTLIGLALLPIVLFIAFSVGAGDNPDGNNGGNGAFALADIATGGAANFALFGLLVSSGFLLVVVVALFCGDTVASEAGWGSLRYLLAIPVPRGRLLAVKLAVGLTFSALSMLILTGSLLLVGFLAYGWEPLRAPLGGEIPAGEAIWRVFGVTGYLTVSLIVVAGLAFLMSVLTDAPLAAVGGAVMLHIVSNILNAVEQLGSLRDILPTRYSQAWLGLLSSPAQFDDMVRGTVTSLAYAAIFVAIAFWRFNRKDITS